MSIFSLSGGKGCCVPTWYKLSIYICYSQLTATCSPAFDAFCISKVVNDFVTMLFSQDQFNVSGRCCRNVVVDQQRHQRVDRVDKLVSIESTRWCRSNGFKLKRSFTGIRKVLEKRIAPGLIYGTFHVEMTYVFLILSSDCQYFLRFWLSNCHDL